MRTWLLLLGGLTVWAVHFFGLYAAGEIGGEATAARLAVLALTLLCLAGNGAIAWLVLRRPSGDEFSDWIRSSALAGVGLSVVAVLWQGLAGFAGL